MTSGDCYLTAEQMFELLRNPVQRRTLETLIESTYTTITLSELAEEIALDEAPSDSEIPTEVADIEIGLHHNHLPKLANAGIIEYDRRSKTVRYRDEECIEQLYYSIINECGTEPSLNGECE